MDSNHVKANASNNNTVQVEVIRSPKAYWDDLNQEEMPLETRIKTKNLSDPDAGYMARANKPKGFHYLAHQYSDADSGIILDVNVTSGDAQDSSCCVERYNYLKETMKLPIKVAGLDAGYDIIAIHYGLSRLGIKAFTRPFKRGITNKNADFSIKKFIWDKENDFYICPNNCKLTFRKIWKCQGIPMRSYVSSAKDCNNCKYRAQCFSSKSEARKIMRKPWQEFQENAHNRVGSPEYDEKMILQQVVCEGNFALQKRCHNLRFTYFRGIEKVSIQCLLSASALNLKRLVKYGNISRIPDIKTEKATLISGILDIYEINICKLLNENIVKTFKLHFCQQTQII